MERMLRVAIVIITLVAAACSPDGGDRNDPVAPDTPNVTASATEGSQSPPGDRNFSIDKVEISLSPIASGLQAPVLVTNAADDRLFVVEQTGFVRVMRDGKLLPQLFLDISSLITAGGEQGLLGLAFHPDYGSNGFFFVNYTDQQGDTVVARYEVSDDPDVAAQSSARRLLFVDQPYSNHNGGGLAFGPDGYLYIGLGDGGAAGDPENRAQNLDTLLGKMLRIDVNRASGSRPYSIPDDNPFASRADARPEIWAYGLRNPWRFAFDRDGGDLWIGDVGQGEVEEIDRVTANDGGLNLGWRVMEGDRCYEPNCSRDGLTLPVSVYEHAGEHCSVTGGYVYRGRSIPSLVGGYLLADYCSGTVWVLDASNPGAGARRVLDTELTISSFGEDNEGELYVTDHGSGQVFKVQRG